MPPQLEFQDRKKEGEGEDLLHTRTRTKLKRIVELSASVHSCFICHGLLHHYVSFLLSASALNVVAPPVY